MPGKPISRMFSCFDGISYYFLILIAYPIKKNVGHGTSICVYLQIIYLFYYTNKHRHKIEINKGCSEPPLKCVRPTFEMANNDLCQFIDDVIEASVRMQRIPVQFRLPASSHTDFTTVCVLLGLQDLCDHFITKTCIPNSRELNPLGSSYCVLKY